VDKEVVLLTPVMIGNSNLPSNFAKEKVSYRAGSALNSSRIFPQVVKEVVGGVLIRMPTHDIKAYLDTVVRTEKMMTDEQMVRFLEEELQKDRANKVHPLNPEQKLERDVLASSMFESLPEKIQGRMSSSLNKLVKRRHFRDMTRHIPKALFKRSVSAESSEQSESEASIDDDCKHGIDNFWVEYRMQKLTKPLKKRALK
jgi:hypothetical protein